MQNTALRIAHFTFAIDRQLAGVAEAVCLINEMLHSCGISNYVFSFGNSKKSVRRSRLLFNRYANVRSEVHVDWSPFANQYGIGFPFFPSILRGKQEFDLAILHQVYSLSTIFGYWFCRIHKLQFVLMPHGVFSPQISSKNRLLKKIATKLVFSKIFDNSAHFIATSVSEVGDIRIATGRDAVVLNLSLKTSRVLHTELRDFASNTVLYAGRFAKEKNLNSLIEAWAVVTKLFPDLVLKLIGYRDLKDQNYIQELVERHRLQSSVSIQEWSTVENLTNEFLNAKLFVLPSLTENFGIVAAEALNCGLPCVVTPAVPISLLIEKYNAGIVAKGYSGAEISQAILSLLAVNLKDYSRNALELAKHEFDLQKVGNEWKFFFETIIFDETREKN